MSDGKKHDYETVRAALRQLLAASGAARDDLLEWVDETESREARDRENAERLTAENERLKRELGKLRTAQAGLMSSRLKDALRE